MDISGTVFKIMPLATGQGKNGTWKKLEFIIEVPGQFPKKVCFSLWGDKIDQANLQEGDNVSVSFDIESREYNNRWYTEAKAWKIEKGGSNAARPAQPEEYPIGDFEPEGSDLPF